MVTGLRVFQFEVCGRLASSRKPSGIIDIYLNSVKKYTPKPYLVPVSSFFPELNSALITEIPVGGWCNCVASSPSGRTLQLELEPIFWLQEAVVAKYFSACVVTVKM